MMEFLDIYKRNSLCRKQRLPFIPEKDAARNPELSKKLCDLWDARHREIDEFLDKATSKAGDTFSSDVKLTCRISFVLNRDNEVLASEIRIASGNLEFDEMCSKALDDLHSKTNIAWPVGTKYESEALVHIFKYPNKWT
jgi:hypothetical protein